MADVFVSYASADRERVLPIVDALEARGWSVWWDRSILPGETWPAAIEHALEHARCVVVCWSKDGVESSWVRLEANRARQRGCLVPVQLDETQPPPEFGAFQCIHVASPATARSLEQIVAGVSRHLRARTIRRAGWTAAAALAAVAVVVAGTCLVGSACGSSPDLGRVAPQRSLAVMSAPAVADGTSATSLAEAFVDDVRRTLRRTAIGDIASRAETVGLPPGASPIEIGRRLRVRWLLMLTITPAPDEWWVLAELIDTSTGFLADDWKLHASAQQLGGLGSDLVRRVLDRFVEDPSAIAIDANEPSEAYVLYLQGRAAFRDGSNEQQLTEAEEIFDGLLLRWPQFARAEAARCQIELLRYETSRAATDLAAGERHCSSALALDPDTAEAALSLGQLHFQAGQYDRAEAEFQRASTSADVRAEANVGLGRIAMAQGRDEDAERAFRAAVVDEPGYWRTYTELGNFLFSVGRAAEAVEAHRRAIALSRHDGVALNNLGAGLFLSGQLDAAVDAWRAALERGDQAPTYSNLGAAYYLDGDYPNSVAMYRRSVELNAEDYRAWSNLADALTASHADGALDAYTRARELASKELERNPDDVVARAGLAAVEAALGEHDAARSSLARALDGRDASDWQLAYLAAVTHVRLGTIDRAEADIEAATAAGYPEVLLRKDPVLAPITVTEEDSP